MANVLIISTPRGIEQGTLNCILGFLMLGYNVTVKVIRPGDKVYGGSEISTAYIEEIK